jgi:hypothetical protein
MKLNTLLNPLNAELNPTCHLLALLEAHHILHVSRIRVKYKLSSNQKKMRCMRHVTCVMSIRKS